MRSGTCPKCHQPTVYRSSEGVGFSYGDGEFMVHVKEWITSASKLQQYVCVGCGYFEAYIDDPSKLRKVAASWKRVTGAAGR
jgi:predicted RNA-binding Zn-ribbon protein involved in translation (DUF1610 family)